MHYRSVTRGLAGARRSEAFDLCAVTKALERVRHSLADNGPTNPLTPVVCASFFTLRELEASAVDRSDLVFGEDSVTLSLYRSLRLTGKPKVVLEHGLVSVTEPYHAPSMCCSITVVVWMMLAMDRVHRSFRICRETTAQRLGWCKRFAKQRRSQVWKLMMLKVDSGSRGMRFASRGLISLCSWT